MLIDALFTLFAVATALIRFALLRLRRLLLLRKKYNRGTPPFPFSYRRAINAEQGGGNKVNESLKLLRLVAIKVLVGYQLFQRLHRFAYPA